MADSKVEESSTDLEKLDPAGIAQAIAGEGEFKAFVEDPTAAAKEIIARILSAETPAEVLEQGAAIHARDILLRPFKIHSVRWQPSSFKDGEGPSVFAVLDAEFLDGLEPLRGPVTCGARNVMAQILRLQQLGTLSEQKLAITEIEGQTAEGYKPMWLVAA